MRVLHINYNYVGTKLHAIMIDHLSNYVDNMVFAPTWRNVESQSHNVIVEKCFNKYDRYFFHLKQFKILNKLLKKVNVCDYDIIHAYTLFTDGNCAYKIHRKYGIPYVVAIRDTDVNAFFKYMVHLRPRGVKIMENAEAVFFLSKPYKDYVFSRYLSKQQAESIEKKTYIVPNGIDDFWLQNKGKKRTETEIGDTINILYVGRINKRKNPLTTLEAINLLSNKGIKIQYNVVGKIDDKKLFDKLISNDSVNYYPPCDKTALINFYMSNTVFVMPSITESFGLAYAEALSQGLPVLYSKNQGFDLQFEDGFVGYAINKFNPLDISNRIMDVLENYSTISGNCLTAVDRFDWNNIVKIYYSVYKKIVLKN